MSWLSGYSKRVKIPATYGSVITNRQIALAIIKGTGSNSAGIIYLNNHALNWPYDIRFTTADGTTLLDYHRVESDSTDGTWFIELDSVDGDTDFYLYYGKSDATDASSLGNTWNSGVDTWYSLNTFGYASAIGRHYGYSTNYNTPFADNWPWQQPAAVYKNGKTYRLLSVKDGTSYKTQIVAFTHSSSTWSSPVDIFTWADADAHRAACICLDSSGYIYVFGGGSESNLYMKKSTNAEDISAWGSAVTVVFASSDDTTPGTDTPGQYGVTYPSAFFAGTDLYCFFRYTAAHAAPVEKRVSYKKSTNNGTSWSARVDVVSPGTYHNCYPTAIWDAANSRCHITWVDYDNAAVKYDELYHAYSDNFTDWYNAAGDHSEANITDAEAESYYLVHACTTTQQISCDVNVDSAGNPYLLSQDSGKYHFHYYSAGWQTVDICDTGQSSAWGDGWLLSGCLIVASSTDFKAYLTVDTSDFAGIDDDKGEIHEYSSTNKTTWTKTATISNDQIKQTWGCNIPKRVHGGGSELTIVFSAGESTDGVVYACGYGSKCTAPNHSFQIPFAWEQFKYGTSPEIALAAAQATITVNAASETGILLMSDAVASPVRYVRVRFNTYALGTNYRFWPITLAWQKTALSTSSNHALIVMWYASNLHLYSFPSKGGTLTDTTINTTSPTANTWYIVELWHSGTTTHVKITKESDGSSVCDADVTTNNYDSASLYPTSGCYAGSTPGTITAYIDYLYAGGYPRAAWNAPGTEESMKIAWPQVIWI